jgi:hypothetical protein
MRQRSLRSRAIRATVPSTGARRSASRSRFRARLSARGIASPTGSSSCKCQRRRLISRLRSWTRPSRWSTSSRTSRSGPSRCATGSPGSRSAARATASASIGSLFPYDRAATRAAAIGFGGTRTTRSPPRSDHAPAAARDDGSPRPPTTAPHPALPPTEPARSDRSSSCRSCTAPAADPAPPTTTTVWLRLCASIPIVTMPPSLLPTEGLTGSAGGHIPVRAISTLPSSHAGRSPQTPSRPHN